MPSRVRISAALTGVCLLVGGCTSGSGAGGGAEAAAVSPQSQTQTPTQPTAPPVVAATPSQAAAAPAPGPQMQTLTLPMSFPGGYKATATLTYSQAILTTDKARVNSAWAAVGGTGAIPCIGDADVHGGSYTWDSSAVAVGTLAFRNDSPGFSMPRFGLFIESMVSTSPTIAGIEYSNGSTCGDGHGLSSLQVAPTMTAATWGPVPIVFAFANARTPDAPNGLAILPPFTVVDTFNDSQNLSIAIQK